MSHIRVIVSYLKPVAVVTQGQAVAHLSKVAPKVRAIVTYNKPSLMVTVTHAAQIGYAAIVNYIHPVVMVSEIPTPVVYAYWDVGDSLWDQDAFGVPQSLWDQET